MNLEHRFLNKTASFGFDLIITALKEQNKDIIALSVMANS